TSLLPSTPPPSLFFNDTPTTEIYPLSLHDALPISDWSLGGHATSHRPAQPQEPGAGNSQAGRDPGRRQARPGARAGNRPALRAPRLAATGRWNVGGRAGTRRDRAAVSSDRVAGVAMGPVEGLAP